MGTVHFGTLTRDVQSIAGIVRRAEFVQECGFDTAAFPDTQCIHPDPFVAMGAVAMAGSPLRLMVSVSNPVTRHPSVVATCMSDLEDAAAGGTVLGMSVGDSALLNIGRQPARLGELRAFVTAVRQLLTTGAAEFGSQTIQCQRKLTPAPIHLAGSGPRALALAGELGDGVWLGTGLDPRNIEEALQIVAQGAARGGRTTADLELGCFVRCHIGDEDTGKQHLAASLAAVGHYALATAPEQKGVPGRYIPAFKELKARYNVVAHADPSGAADNGRLARDLGLLDYLAERFAIIGPLAFVKDRFRDLASAGVRSFTVVTRGPDADEQLRRVGKEVIPALRHA